MIQLQPADKQDIPVLTSLIRASFAEYNGKLKPPSGAHAETETSIASKFAKGGAFLAMRDSEAVGCVLYEIEPEYLYLGRLAVLPAHRRHGIGVLLVETVENRSRELHIPIIQLGVRVALPGNRAFFERLGYQFVHSESHPGFTEPTFIIMQKTLSLTTSV